MLKNNDSDTKAFRIIAKIYDFLILHHGLNYREYNVRWKTAIAVKKVLADQVGLIYLFYIFDFVTLLQ